MRIKIILQDLSTCNKNYKTLLTLKTFSVNVLENKEQRRHQFII